MKKEDKPNFAAWSNENLARFASESYDRMQELTAANEQLRIDLKSAMAELRKHVDDWK